MRSSSFPSSLRLFRSTMCATALLAACGTQTSLAQFDTRVVGYTGQPVDGVRSFHNFEPPILNESGTVGFWARTVIDTIANDECMGAIEIFYGVTSVANTYASSTALPAWCGNRDVWFRYVCQTGFSGQTQVRFGIGYPVAPGVAVYSGNCGQLQVVAQTCNTGDGTTFGAIVGTTYYIRVGWTSASETYQRWPYRLEIFNGTIVPSTAMPIPNSRDGGIWIDQGGVPAEVVRDAQTPTFESGTTYRSVFFPGLGNDNSVVFTPVTRSGGLVPEITRASLVRAEAGGVFTRILQDAPVEQPITERWLTPIAQIGENGRLAYSLNDGSRVMYGAAQVLRGDAAPGTPAGTTFLFIDQPVESGGAPIVFRGTLAGTGVTEANNMGLWVDRGAGVGLLARTGGAAPGTGEGVVWRDLALQPGITDTGAVVFHGRLAGTGVTPPNDSGIWLGLPSGVRLVARAGNAAPGGGGDGGAVFSSFSTRAHVNRSSQVVFVASITGSQVTPMTNSGVWLAGADGALSLLALENQPVSPTIPGVLFDNFNDPILDDFGAMYVLARVRGTGVTTANNHVLLALRGAAHRVIARAGELFTLPSMQTKTIKRVLFGESGPGSEGAGGGGRAAVNHRREVAYKLLFTDDTEAVCVARDTCIADWNYDGFTNSQDLFDFLIDFFANRSDVTGDGFVNSQDFFEYLTAFFTGCK